MKRDAVDAHLERLIRWWDNGSSIAIACLFWFVMITMILATIGMGSMDLFIKAVTATATAMIAIMVWVTTRAFQRSSIRNAESKLRLDLFEKRWPIWESFRDIRARIVGSNRVTADDLQKLANLSRDVQILIDDDGLISGFERYVVLAQRLYIADHVTKSAIISREEWQAQQASSEIQALGVKLGDGLVQAIKIGDLR